MGCPSCGAEISYDKRLAVLTVCEYCNSAVVYDEKAASIAGKMAVLAKAAGPVFLGAVGSLKKTQDFTVIGRVRYGYENGFWDEWYLQHEDQSTSWFTEDEKRFMHEMPQKLDIDKEAILSLTPGQALEFGNDRFSVREIGVAVCEGGEGQLPFKVISGEEIHFVDLINEDGETATIEVEPEGQVKFYRGTPVSPAEIQVHNESYNQQDSLAVEKAASGNMRERVTYNTNRMKVIQCIHCGGTNDNIDLNAEHIKCSHCGQSLEFPENSFNCPSCSAQVQSYTSGAKSLTCPYCSSSINMSSGKPSLLRKLKNNNKEQKKKFGLPIQIGDRADFDGLSFIVVGYLRYKEVDEGIPYISHEYLMYNETWGYRWLVAYDGHYTIQEKFTKEPAKDPKSLRYFSYKEKFEIDGQKWQFYEKGSGAIDWIEGEFSWVAKVGDKSKYYEAIAPPFMIAGEVTDKELEWFKFRYAEKSEIAAAFKKDESKFRDSNGVYACQVNHKKSYQITTVLVALFFATLAALAFMMGTSEKSVIHFKVKNKQYKEEFLSPAFNLNRDDGVYRIDFFSPVKNSWVYLDLALVNEHEEAEIDFSAEISYYYGYDDGRWTEGSRNDSTYFKAKKGTYRLLMKGDAGKGESTVNVNAGEPVTIRIYEGVKVRYYFIIFAVFAAIIAVFYFFSMLSFESSRWKHTYEED